ncbi:MAG TPA: hypothetical protein EYH40_01785 [Desulfurococcales archaeon]|nr:hypothetical protein [Desulfurococcales archaeon]
MSEKRKSVEGKLENDVSKDILELKGALTAITEFLRDITGPLKDIISIIQSYIAGDKLGKDIANFYRSLKESGLPDDIINDFVKRYYDERINIMKLLGKIFEYGRKVTPSTPEKEKEKARG